MSTPDPAERMARIREAMAREGARLRDLMANVDENGHPTTPTDQSERTTDEH